jgi:hypothetical protein
MNAISSASIAAANRAGQNGGVEAIRRKRSPMMSIRNSLLGACLALPLVGLTGHAQAAQPDGGRTIYVPPGAVVLILPGLTSVAAPYATSAATPETMPMMRLIAQQQAAMQRMIADMDAMFPPMPDPSQLLRAAFGSDMAVAPLAGGHGMCSQSITIVERGDGSAPIVKTAQTGDACGALGIGKPQNIHEVPMVPVAPARGPKVLEVGFPPHPVSTGTPPRT